LFSFRFKRTDLATILLRPFPYREPAVAKADLVEAEFHQWTTTVDQKGKVQPALILFSDILARTHRYPFIDKFIFPIHRFHPMKIMYVVPNTGFPRL
jgi:hypothetical protein